MIETHFERYMRDIGSDSLRGAERAVDRLGDHALRDFAFEMIGYELERGTGRRTEMGAALTAIPYVIVDREARIAPDPLDILPLVKRPAIAALIQDMLAMNSYLPNPGQTPDFANTLFLTQHQMVVYNLLGRQTYELSPGLTERLDATELRGIKTDELRLPFSSVYIAIPDVLDFKIEIAKIEGPGTERYPLTGLYVTAGARPNDRGLLVPGWRIVAWGAGTRPFDDALFHFFMPLQAGLDLGDAINEADRDATRAAESSDHTRIYYALHWKRLFRLALNTIVYVTWPDAEIREQFAPGVETLRVQMARHPKGSRKYERVRAALRDLDPRRRIYLGASVPRLQREVYTPNGPLNGPLTVRTLVSGHWQRFAHGEGRTLRRWGWRQPFWRGPDEAPTPDHLRIVR